MKKFLKFGGIGLGVLVLVIVILAIVAPTEYTVERSVTINANRAAVWAKVNTLKGMNEWSPWNERDPDLKYNYSGTDGQVGAVYSWEGNDDVGVGEQEITEIDPMNRLTTELRFKAPREDVAIAHTLLEDDGSGTKVTWKFEGKAPVPGNIFLMFMDLDGILGADFEKGLGYLKEQVES